VSSLGKIMASLAEVLSDNRLKMMKRGAFIPLADYIYSIVDSKIQSASRLTNNRQ
jgi:hypothetical protein